MRDQSVAQLDCIAERLHRQGAFGDAGKIEEIRYRPERENEMVVFERVRVSMEAMRNHYLLALDVDLIHVATEEIPAANHFSDGIHDVGQIQIARRDLV